MQFTFQFLPLFFSHQNIDCPEKQPVPSLPVQQQEIISPESLLQQTMSVCLQRQSY